MFEAVSQKSNRFRFWFVTLNTPETKQQPKQWTAKSEPASKKVKTVPSIGVDVLTTLKKKMHKQPG